MLKFIQFSFYSGDFYKIRRRKDCFCHFTFLALFFHFAVTINHWICNGCVSVCVYLLGFVSFFLCASKFVCQYHSNDKFSWMVAVKTKRNRNKIPVKWSESFVEIPNWIDIPWKENEWKFIFTKLHLFICSI